jgi:hypothetical protein
MAMAVPPPPPTAEIVASVDRLKEQSVTWLSKLVSFDSTLGNEVRLRIFEFTAHTGWALLRECANGFFRFGARFSLQAAAQLWMAEQLRELGLEVDKFSVDLQQLSTHRAFSPVRE